MVNTPSPLQRVFKSLVWRMRPRPGPRRCLEKLQVVTRDIYLILKIRVWLAILAGKGATPSSCGRIQNWSFLVTPPKRKVPLSWLHYGFNYLRLPILKSLPCFWNASSSNMGVLLKRRDSRLLRTTSAPRRWRTSWIQWGKSQGWKRTTYKFCPVKCT